ncbi:hypothetical protein [Piscirickettsia litoralis]|uniref:Uncharacterized protein n=1 Tax=Piscirickettsia litoralis TaxID=1891921 RepID=A0ABX3A234_9GAMM|nr:hypothetical protein [Piscirickettsia litoralis]ODN42555.1 hypothetical protein BGC07_05950 [Piscirickettsia litoralis]
MQQKKIDILNVLDAMKCKDIVIGIVKNIFDTETNMGRIFHTKREWTLRSPDHDRGAFRKAKLILGKQYTV